jgi:hypothetical protein
VVESTGLENRRTRKGTVSSNLTLSAGWLCWSAGPVSALERRARAASALGDCGAVVVMHVPGSVAEWFKAHAWKVCVRESVP